MSSPVRRWWPASKRLAAFAMLAIPWYLRDGEAVELDKSVIVAQEVLAEKDAALLRQEQDEMQREMLRALTRIEGRQTASTEAQLLAQALDSFEQTLREEGGGLEKSANTLKRLMERVTIDPGTDFATWNEANAEWLKNPNAGTMPLCQRTCMEGVVKKAEDVANIMVNPEFLKQASDDQVEALQQEYIEARDHLGIAYADLSIEADGDRQQAATDAEGARSLAWVFTGLGGLLLGDWKKLLTGSDSEPADA